MENPTFRLEGVVKSRDEAQDFEGPLSLILMLLQKNKSGGKIPRRQLQNKKPHILTLENKKSEIRQKKPLPFEKRGRGFLTVKSFRLNLRSLAQADYERRANKN